PAHDITARPTPGPHTRPEDPLKRRRFGRRAARQGPLPPQEKPPGRPRAAKPANLRRMPEPKAAPKPPPTHPFLFHHVVQRATGTKARATTWPRTPGHQPDPPPNRAPPPRRVCYLGPPRPPFKPFLRAFASLTLAQDLHFRTKALLTFIG